MPKKRKERRLPRGLTRLFFRIPIALYELGLGGLLGTRFVMLTHTGRKSGQKRKTVLEVVRYDRLTGECIIASGWGTKSDWFQNITANPRVAFQVGNHCMEGIARRLTPEEGAREMQDYARRYPLAYKEISRFLGYTPEETKVDVQTVGRMLPLFILEPRKGDQ